KKGKLSETADVLHKWVRDYRNITGEDQRLQRYYMKWSGTADIVQEMPETADILQERIRDCRHSTGDDDQRLWTQYRR
ncbi:unnamed protein product, partial [Staurois parvus]